MLKTLYPKLLKHRDHLLKDPHLSSILLPLLFTSRAIYLSIDNATSGSKEELEAEGKEKKYIYYTHI